MNIGKFKDVGTRVFHRGVLTAKKYSPELLTAGAVVGVIGTAILASRATLKAQPMHADMKLEAEEIKQRHDLSEDEIKRVIAKHYISSYVNISKTFAPAATMAVTTVACVLGAHGIMKRRNAIMAVAYKALETTFEEYRARVTEELGEEREREVRHNFKIEEKIDEVTGKKVKVKSVSRNGASPYARAFDERNANWQGEFDYNDLFLRTQQNYANDMLRIRGHVTLNDVYDRLGLDRCPEGQLVGWVRDGEGDGFIDFGLDAPQWKEAGVWHLPSEILLDFNVDGFIFELIK